MTARIAADRDICVGAGTCVLTLPHVFDQDDEGLVVVLDPAADGEPDEALRQVAAWCPSGAITTLGPG
ncbi:ferredoxin [Couchioplanes azureus]|uniref:ferredoxin n=1 Tax=Couchioplanes caeruleus TaxID=56438 RepID=UPI00166F861B|nr:(4Fe-4S)-binding protein [Couchioplanes caeruleus]GGQ60444.1 ferredoxin [Couchioplanes caeruleus subsp. azureus]